jgi:hypothetical protein
MWEGEVSLIRAICDDDCLIFAAEMDAAENRAPIGCNYSKEPR